MRWSALVLLLLVACGDEIEVHVSVDIAMVTDDPAAATLDATATAVRLIGHGDMPGASGVDIAIVLDGHEIALQQNGEGRYACPQQIGFPQTLAAFVEDQGLALERSEPFTMQLTPITNGFELAIAPGVVDGESVSVNITRPGAMPFESFALGTGTTKTALPGDTTHVEVRRLHSAASDFTASVSVVRELAITR